MIFGAIKQVVGLFVAVYIIAKLTPDAAATANEPVHQFLDRLRAVPAGLGGA